MSGLSPDARVQFPQEMAPLTESLAQAVIKFADALAKGDDAKFASMLAAESRGTLDKLTSSGGWDEAVKKIEGVRVSGLSETAGEEKNATAANVLISVQEPGAAYALLWTATRNGDQWTFDARPSAGGTKPRASDWDTGSPTPDTSAASGRFTDTSAVAGGAIVQLPGAGGGSGGPAPKKNEDGTVRKNTPGGPVDVPTGPQPGPGGG